MKTLAAFLVEINKDLEIDEIEIPKLKYGQALVKINYSGMCGTQISEILGHKGEDKWLPHCLGHEATGIIIECGDGVTKVKPEDKVVLSWIKGEGIDAGGCKYKLGNIEINAGPVTTLQEYAVVSENRLYHQPSNLDDVTSIILGCAAPTGMGSVFNVLRAESPSKVAIIGTGGIGLCSCLACIEKNITDINVIEPNLNRQKLALEFGASKIIKKTDLNSQDKFLSEHSNMYDYIIESSGKIASIKLAINLMKNQGGKTVVIGNAPLGSDVSFPTEIFNQGKSLLGTWGGDCDMDKDIEKYSKIIFNNLGKIKSLFSEPYSIHNINKAVNDFLKGDIGRPLIKLN